MPAPLRIPYAPLSDAQWEAILPHLPASTRGRPCDARARFDAIFRIAATDGPWCELPESFGKPDTVSRFFRRLTHDGLWERLLKALAAAPKGSVMHGLLGLICRATRRAMRIRGLALNYLARLLKLDRALPAPPHMLPDPILSEKLLANRFQPRNPLRTKADVAGYQRILRRLRAVAAGRKRIPAIFKRIWV